MRKRKVTVYLDPQQHTALQALARGNRTTVSTEAQYAVRRHLAQTATQTQESQAAPLLDRLLTERLAQIEAWLRPMVAAANIHATTGMLLALEVLCGSRVERDKARETLELVRGRAYRMLRRREEGEPIQTGG